MWFNFLPACAAGETADEEEPLIFLWMEEVYSIVSLAADSNHTLGRIGLIAARSIRKSSSPIRLINAAAEYIKVDPQKEKSEKTLQHIFILRARYYLEKKEILSLSNPIYFIFFLIHSIGEWCDIVYIVCLCRFLCSMAVGEFSRVPFHSLRREMRQRKFGSLLFLFFFLFYNFAGPGKFSSTHCHVDWCVGKGRKEEEEK